MSKILSDFNENGKVNTNVAQSILYSDIDLKFQINPITNDVSILTDIGAVKNSIKNLVLTNFHERPFQPMLGSGLIALLFEPAGIYTSIQIKNAITKVINRYESRATDVTIQINDRSEENGYDITVGFRVFYDDRLNEVEFFLTRLR